MAPEWPSGGAAAFRLGPVRVILAVIEALATVLKRRPSERRAFTEELQPARGICPFQRDDPCVRSRFLKYAINGTSPKGVARRNITAL